MSEITNGSIESFVPYGSGEFVKVVEDGVEYYTEVTTGLSGMSYRGLARFLGTAQPAVSYWVKKINDSDLINNKLPECLKPFAGKALNLINKSDPEGSEILPDIFCAAMIAYYAMFAAPLDQTREAKLALMTLGAMGMRSFIQTKTGWNPRTPPSASQVTDRDIHLKQIELEIAKTQLAKAQVDKSILEISAQPNGTKAEPAPSKRQPKPKSLPASKEPKLWSGTEDRPNAETVDFVLNILARGTPATACEIASEVEISNGYVRRILAYLYRVGKVARKRIRGAKYSPLVYTLPQPTPTP